MDDKNFSSNDSVFVQVIPALSEEDVENEDLSMYLENTLKTAVEDIQFNESRTWAIARLTNSVNDITKLQNCIKEKSMEGHSITLKAVPSLNKVLATDLPSELVDEILKECDELKNCELVLCFESKRHCPEGGDVESVDVLPCHHAVVVCFKDPAVAKRLKKNQGAEKKFCVRPFSIFEYVEDPYCSMCQESKAQHMEDDEAKAMPDDRNNGADDTEQHEDSSDNDRSTPDENEYHTPKETEDETDESLKPRPSTTKENENVKSFSASEEMSANRHVYRPIRYELFKMSHKYNRIPGLQPSEHEFVKMKDKQIEVRVQDPETAQLLLQKIRSEDNMSEISLDEYMDAEVAKKLLCDEGKKWIGDLFTYLKLPAQLTKLNSTVAVQALTPKLAKEAAQAVANSLLPAKIHCKDWQKEKLLKPLGKKIIVSKWSDSGWLYLLGMPQHVIEAVGEIEQKLSPSFFRRKF